MKPDRDDSQAAEDIVFEFLERVEGDRSRMEEILAELAARQPEHAVRLRRSARQLVEFGLMPEDEEPGALQIGPYRAEERLGAGGMGVIYRARRTQQGGDELAEPTVDVALKVLRDEQRVVPAAIERFEREIDAASRLDHPNIVRVLDHGQDETRGTRYVAFELHRGNSLDRAIAAGGSSDQRQVPSAAERVPGAFLRALGIPDDALEVSPTYGGPRWQVALRIARQIARGLAHAHSRGVIHRDVKPSNVWATREGRILLLDFGLASLKGASRLTASGALVGSLPYMAPEQLREGHRGDEGADVYALGVTLFETLTGRLPFESDGPEALCRAIERNRIPELRPNRDGLVRDLPHAGRFQAVLERALEGDPKRRYVSISAFEADLTALLEGREPRARRDSTLTRTARWVRKRPFVAATAGLTALLAIGVPSGYAVLSSQRLHAMETGLASTLGSLATLLEAVDRGTNTLDSGPLKNNLRLSQNQLESIGDALSLLNRAETDAAVYFEDQPERSAPLWVKLQMSRLALLLARADRLEELEKPEDAEEAYEAHQNLARSIVESHPQHARAHWDLGASLGNAARLRMKLDEGAQVTGQLTEARSELEAALRYGGDERLLKGDLVQVDLMLANALEREGRKEAAIERRSVAIAALEERVASAEGTALDGCRLAEALLATRLEPTDNPELALILSRRVQTLLVPRLEASPEDWLARTFQVEAIEIEALSLFYLHRDEEAADRLEEGFQEIDLMLEAQPDARSFVERHRSLEGTRALLQSRFDIAEARAAAESLVAQRRQAFERSGLEQDGVGLAVSLNNAAGLLMMAEILGDERLAPALEHAEESIATSEKVLASLHSRGAHDEALETIRESAQSVLWLATYTATVICCFMDDVQAAERWVRTLEERGRGKTVRQLRLLADAWNEVWLTLERTRATASEQERARSRTLEILEAAVDAGFGDRGELESTKALDALRDDPRFQALLKKL
ncbi:MAG: serine/threonine-protein kinase [Planctomycetota bacterium]